MGDTFSVGDVLEYSGCVKVEVLAAQLEGSPAYYTIRMPDGQVKKTVPNLLDRWEDSKGIKAEPDPNWIGDAPHLHPTPAKPGTPLHPTVGALCRPFFVNQSLTPDALSGVSSQRR